MSILYLQTSKQTVRHLPSTVFRFKTPSQTRYKLTDQPGYRGMSELPKPNFFYLFFASFPNFPNRRRRKQPDVTMATTTHKQPSRLGLLCAKRHSSALRYCFALLTASWRVRSDDFNETKNQPDKQPKWIIMYCAHPKMPKYFFNNKQIENSTWLFFVTKSHSRRCSEL